MLKTIKERYETLKLFLIDEVWLSFTIDIKIDELYIQ